MQPTSSLDTQQAVPLDREPAEGAQNQLYEHKQHQHRLVRFGLLGLLAILVATGVIFIIFHRSSASEAQLANFAPTHVALPDIATDTLPSSNKQALRINGQLQANDSIVMAPIAQPASPVLGQLYFDKSTKHLLYYDGTRFSSLGNIITNVTNNSYTTNQGGATIINQGDTIVQGDTIINNITEGSTDPTVLLQGGTPGTVQNGNFNISGTGQVGSLTVTGAATVGSATIQGAATMDTATVQGSLTAGSLTTGTITAPTGGNLAVGTPDASGLTGSVIISTGNSTTTASGDITIDSGSGFVDGQLILSRTFESGIDNMQAWYGDTIAQSGTTAHGGTESLQMTAAGGNWGIIENANGTLAHVTPGHLYYFSLWVRAGSTPRSISASLSWGSTSTTIGSTTDSTTGWTQISGTASAPAGATTVSLKVTGTASAGEIHYFDDYTITDLSSASAASQIRIGTTNAKVITIGNMNQIGATTINGNSGITLNGGSATIQENGGVINLNASAASSFTASQGALTLSAAATSSWGITQATSGVGGDLTLHAGKGGSDTNNNGGNVILQGGASNGTGTAGSVIVRPLANTTSTFQIQNATSSPLLVADTTNMQLVINGHLISGNATGATTVAAGAAACTTPTVVINGNDTAGTVTITTGTGCTTTGNLATVTFAHSYNTAPHISLTPGNAAAANLSYYRETTTGTFGISSASTPSDSTIYIYDYQVIQ